MTPRASAVTASIGGIVLVAGCYRYQPIGAEPQPGVEVRLDLSAAGTSELARVLGEHTVAVEGRVDRATDTAFVIAVSGTRKEGDASATVWSGEPVAVPRTAVSGVQRRSLDKRRTFLVAGAAVAGAVLTKLIVSAVGSKSGGDDGGGGTTPP